MLGTVPDTDRIGSRALGPGTARNAVGDGGATRAGGSSALCVLPFPTSKVSFRSPLASGAPNERLRLATGSAREDALCSASPFARAFPATRWRRDTEFFSTSHVVLVLARRRLGGEKSESVPDSSKSAAVRDTSRGPNESSSSEDDNVAIADIARRALRLLGDARAP